MGTTTAGSPSARLTPRKRPSAGSHPRKTRGLAERRSPGSLRREPGGAQGSQAPLREVAPPLRAAGPTSARARPDYLRQARAARDRRAGLGARSAPGPAPGLARPALSTLQFRPDYRGRFQALPTAAGKGRAFALLPPRPDPKDGWILLRRPPPSQSKCKYWVNALEICY